MEYKCLNIVEESKGNHINLSSRSGDLIGRMLAYDDYNHGPCIKREVDAISYSGYPMELVYVKRELSRVEIDHVNTLNRSKIDNYYKTVAELLCRKVESSQELKDLLSKVSPDINVTVYNVDSVDGTKHFIHASTCYAAIVKELIKQYNNCNGDIEKLRKHLTHFGSMIDKAPLKKKVVTGKRNVFTAEQIKKRMTRSLQGRARN